MSHQIIVCPGCGRNLEIFSAAWSGKGKCQFCGCKFRLRYDSEVLVSSPKGALPNLITMPAFAPAPAFCPDCHKELAIPFEAWNGKVKCQCCECKFLIKCKPEVLMPGSSSPSVPPPVPVPVSAPVAATPPKIQVFRKPMPGVRPATSETPLSSEPDSQPAPAQTLSIPAAPPPAMPGPANVSKTGEIQKPALPTESTSIENLKERVMKIRLRVASTPPQGNGS